jgi:hypothetical protein
MGDPEQTVFGISPLSGNSVDGTSVEGVPLFWDSRAQAYVSEQAIEELDDRDISLAQAREYEKEKSFNRRAGITGG